MIRLWPRIVQLYNCVIASCVLTACLIHEYNTTLYNRKIRQQHCYDVSVISSSSVPDGEAWPAQSVGYCGSGQRTGPVTPVRSVCLFDSFCLSVEKTARTLWTRLLLANQAEGQTQTSTDNERQLKATVVQFWVKSHLKHYEVSDSILIKQRSSSLSPQTVNILVRLRDRVKNAHLTDEQETVFLVFLYRQTTCICAFYRATAKAYARSCYRHVSVCLSVCLSVCPSANACIATKWDNCL